MCKIFDSQKLGLGRQELEHLVDEGMDPYPDDGRTYEERIFDEMLRWDSSESDEGSDNFPCDEAVELDLREEDREWFGRYY